MSYSEGVRQAKDYAERLQCRIAYASNGHDIYQINLLTGEEGLVDDYLSPQGLWALTFKAQDKQLPDFNRIWRDRFSAIPFECIGESLFLRKLVLGIPAQASSKNLTRPLMPPAAPIRPRHLVPTQQGVGT
uniref:hypothetical protein n=1 Tax=Bathymodiolus platifrons methanotrophic gill symbiont TaxID=113268 RepID=UPI0027D920DB|nr:hypothetical protein [Bathymodiolus platifrons methanotrophic gill symbiont]